MINMGMSLYNKVLDHVKLKDIFNSFKRDLKSVVLKGSFYSFDELMSF
jgi:hypothetical protein